MYNGRESNFYLNQKFKYINITCFTIIYVIYANNITKCTYT